MVTNSGADCIFHEPQFDPKLVQTLSEGTDASTGILDPMGMQHAPGEDAYFQIMSDISNALVMCLGKTH